MKILVTGGAGFIGSYVVDRLTDDGHSVLVFDHTAAEFMRPMAWDEESHFRVQHFLGDIRDEVAVTEAMSHVDGFIHLAGVLGTQETIGNPKPAIMTNITAGLNVLEAAVQYGIPGINIAVGNYWEQNPYSISKNTVERLVEMYRRYRGAKVSSIRALNAYGPRQSVAQPYGDSQVRKIMPSFVMRALHEDPIEIYGDGNQIMDMIYVADVASFLVDGLYKVMAEGPFEEVVEAGTGRDTTVSEIARLVVEVAGKGNIQHLPPRPGETPGAVVKADVATHSVIYPEGKELVPLEEGIARTVEYYENKLGARNKEAADASA